LAELLRLHGHTVEVVFTGLAALEIVGAFKPEVVLLDIGLPGMSGYEIARRLRARKDGADFALIAVTGYGNDEAVQRSRESGFDAHLVKPVEPESLEQSAAKARSRVASDTNDPLPPPPLSSRRRI
jgi:two-component system CheB/CheR fusion protein